METMSTDSAWEEWGRRDPYYGVITNPKFRRTGLTSEAKSEFFESGRAHIQYVMRMIRLYIDVNFQPKTILDFGCGVGRLTIPFADAANSVLGLDVSPSMLAEAQRNCEEARVANVHFMQSDDTLSELSEKFDLVHSFIVFQHIRPSRGRAIFSALLDRLNPNGVGAVHFAYSKCAYAATHGVPPTPPQAQPATQPKYQAIGINPNADPEMQMNPYNMNELLFLLQTAGILRFHAEFTDHGGELGLFLFFQKPPA